MKLAILLRIQLWIECYEINVIETWLAFLWHQNYSNHISRLKWSVIGQVNISQLTLIVWSVLWTVKKFNKYPCRSRKNCNIVAAWKFKKNSVTHCRHTYIIHGRETKQCLIKCHSSIHLNTKSNRSTYYSAYTTFIIAYIFFVRINLTYGIVRLLRMLCGKQDRDTVCTGRNAVNLKLSIMWIFKSFFSIFVGFLAIKFTWIFSDMYLNYSWYEANIDDKLLKVRMKGILKMYT